MGLAVALDLALWRGACLGAMEAEESGRAEDGEEGMKGRRQGWVGRGKKVEWLPYSKVEGGHGVDLFRKRVSKNKEKSKKPKGMVAMGSDSEESKFGAEDVQEKKRAALWLLRMNLSSSGRRPPWRQPLAIETCIDGKVTGRRYHSWRPSAMPLTLSQRPETAAKFLWTEQ
ncbi:hypothetical protein Taro_002324 [Colocasia esculenta]|uniref:Uncharacterized protein n=1 Tax=Colocasia esculenta TaxID=4460 RepID=A0A843TND6_COLES|nr:hypothetical protein [Colocasia esculenta]